MMAKPGGSAPSIAMRSLMLMGNTGAGFSGTSLLIFLTSLDAKKCCYGLGIHHKMASLL